MFTRLSRRNYVLFASLVVFGGLIFYVLWQTAVPVPLAAENPMRGDNEGVYLPITFKPGTPPPQIAGLRCFPRSDNIWNASVDYITRACELSQLYQQPLVPTRGLHPDFGVWCVAAWLRQPHWDSLCCCR